MEGAKPKICYSQCCIQAKLAGSEEHHALTLVEQSYRPLSMLMQAKLAGLEEQVAELSGRVHSLELEKARYRAERDALSQRVDTLQSSSGPRPPTPEQLVRTCSRDIRAFACNPSEEAARLGVAAAHESTLLTAVGLIATTVQRAQP